MEQNQKTMTLQEALQLKQPSVYNVYFKNGGSPIPSEDYDKYLNVTGHLETYDDYDGDDDYGRPIILHLLWFFLDITENQAGGK